MSDWWARKLAPAVPPKYGLTVPQPQPVYYPQQQTSAPVQAPPPSSVQAVVPAPTDEMTAGEAVRRWQGGEANRIGGACPGCGSKSGYTPGYKQGRVSGHSPRPHCFECGYNGEYEQADAASWGVVA